MSGRRHAWLIATAGLIVIGGGSMLAAERRPAGGGPMDLTAAAAATTTALAGVVDERLGMPVPASRNAARVSDTATGQALDEVTDLDATGKPLAITRFDLSGTLVSSVRLGYLAPVGLTVTAAAASAGAATVVGNLGLSVTGQPAVSTRAAGGWLVRWVRLVNGIPAPGDGVSVQLAANGAFHGIVRTERPFVPAPGTVIDEARVRLMATARLDAWFSAELHGEATISAIARAWIVPNDTFGDPLPAGPAGALRLAWVVRVTTSGTLADRVAGLELAFDAGDGSPLGGDVLE